MVSSCVGSSIAGICLLSRTSRSEPPEACCSPLDPLFAVAHHRLSARPAPVVLRPPTPLLSSRPAQVQSCTLSRVRRFPCDVGDVLSIGKLGGGGSSERYYTQAVASGREDYYAGRGEAPGTWAGTGASALDVDGLVKPEDLAALFKGQNPASGAQLRRAPKDGEVSAFDLTFRAPKSVSILFGVGDEDVAPAVRAAHDEAVANALGYLERHACETRRGAGGRQSVKGDGFIAAAFRHRTSRAGDPQLHTHLVVGNLTRGPEGRWTTLDARQLYRHAKTAGYLYQSALRAELTDRLGVRWGSVEKGAADLAGVSRELIEHFSRRRAEIVEHMRSRGEWSLRSAQVASLATRRRKDYGVPVDRLRQDWQARAAEHGFGRDEVADLLNRTERFPAARLALARRAADLGGPAGVTRDSSTFDRRDVVQAWAERHREGQRAGDIEALADGWLSSGAAVRIDPRAWSP